MMTTKTKVEFGYRGAAKALKSIPHRIRAHKHDSSMLVIHTGPEHAELLQDISDALEIDALITVGPTYALLAVSKAGGQKIRSLVALR